MTTVGYGDYFPTSAVGRFLVAYPAMIVGVGVLGYLAATVADAVIETASKRRRGLLEMDMKDHIVICNMPGAARVRHVVEELRLAVARRDCKVVLVTDGIEQLPPELEQLNIEFVRGDPVLGEVLERANVQAASGVFVLASDPTNPVCDKISFAVCAVLDGIRRERKAKFRIVAEVIETAAQSMFASANVDSLIASEGINDALLAQEFVHPGLHDVFQELISASHGAEFYIYDTTLDGVSVIDLQKAMIENAEEMQLIGVIQDGKHLLNPPRDYKIKQGARIVVLANDYGDFAGVENGLKKGVASEA
jgi:voltage-gated potassium channel